MEKTKLGLSVNLLAAIAFLCAYFGGYVASILLVGYILIAESNQWLRQMALKSVLIMILFSALSILISLIPDIADFFFSIIHIIKPDFGYSFTSFLTRCQTVLANAYYLIKLAAFAVLSILAAQGKTIRIPFIDQITDRLTDRA